MRIASAETKDMLFLKIAKSLDTGAKLGKDIFVGSNSVARLLERNHAAVIAVCRDSNHNLTDHIIEAAKLKSVPVLILPKCIDELVSLLKLKSVSCFGISNGAGDDIALSAPNAMHLKCTLMEKRSKKRKVEVLNGGEHDTSIPDVSTGLYIPQVTVDDRNEIIKENEEETIIMKGSKEDGLPGGDSIETAEEDSLLLSACMDDLRDAMIFSAS